MTIDKLAKETIKKYCKMFEISPEDLSKELNEISECDKKLIKTLCEMKVKSISEFKKEYPEINEVIK